MGKTMNLITQERLGRPRYHMQSSHQSNLISSHSRTDIGLFFGGFGTFREPYMCFPFSSLTGNCSRTIDAVFNIFAETINCILLTVLFNIFKFSFIGF